MKRTLLLGVSFLIISACTAYAFQPGTPSGYIAVVRPAAPFNPLTERFIDSQISAAEAGGAALVLLDTGAAHGYSAAVGAIADRIQSSQVPVVVLPTAGGKASRAVAYLMQSAAVLPGRSSAARSATSGFSSVDRFVAQLDGQTILFHGRSIVLHTLGVTVRTFEMNGIARLLAELLNPNLAYVLLLVGIIGIAVEFSIPGVGLPGVLGGLSLLISLVALGALSVNLGGLLLILLSLGLFVLDIKAPTHGILTAGGVAALLAGSFLLFPGRAGLPGLRVVAISPVAIVVMTALLSAVLVSAVVVGTRAQHRKIQAGKETLVGLVGVALTDLKPNGTVRVANEEWSAVSVGEEIKAGEEVDVVDVQGVHLVIMRRII